MFKQKRVLASGTTWTIRMYLSVNKLRNREPSFTSGMRVKTNTLRVQCRFVLKYLRDRQKGKRNWANYGKKVRDE